MSETKNLVKCALGFILAIIVMVGGAFGLDVKVNVDDTNSTNSEAVGNIAEEPPVEATDEVAENNQQSPVDSTPTEDEVPSVDESVEAEVTEPTDDTQETVTENIEKGEN